MNQVDLRRNARESGLKVIRFEIQEQVAAPINTWGGLFLLPHCALQALALMDGKASLEQHEIPVIRPDRKLYYIALERAGPIDVSDEGDGIDEAHGGFLKD
jgi:hypothetical protein